MRSSCVVDLLLPCFKFILFFNVKENSLKPRVVMIDSESMSSQHFIISYTFYKAAKKEYGL